MSTRARWREHVRAWRASGDTAADYCDRVGLNPRTLSWWAWKLGRDATPERAEPEPRHPVTPAFVELAPVEVIGSGFELQVGSVVVRVPVDFDTVALGRLLDVVKERR